MRDLARGDLWRVREASLLEGLEAEENGVRGQERPKPSEAESLLYTLPTRRYASAGLCESNVSVCPSVCHAPVLSQKEES